MFRLNCGTITPIVTPIAPTRQHIQSTCTGGNASIVSFPPADATKKIVARKYNLGRKGDKFCEGNLVLCRLHLSSYKGQNISAKRLLRWSTPVKIVRKIRSNVVLLADPDTGSIVRRDHVSQLLCGLRVLFFPSLGCRPVIGCRGRAKGTRGGYGGKRLEKQC